MPSHSGTGYSSFYIVSGGVIVGIAYLRVWKGWTFSSMMPVTKEALKQGLSTIRSGVDGLSRKIQEVKDFVDERVEALSRKQDDLAESQEEMKDQLGDVQNNIQGMRGDIKTIEGDMKQFRDQQMYTNEGIFTLCSVLKDIMSGQGQKARGSRAQTLLDMFLNRTPKLPVHHNAGLESLLESADEGQSENRGPLATRAMPFRQRSGSLQDETQNLIPIARSRTQSDGLTGLRRSDSASSSFSSGFWHRQGPAAQ